MRFFFINNADGHQEITINVINNKLFKNYLNYLFAINKCYNKIQNIMNN